LGVAIPPPKNNLRMIYMKYLIKYWEDPQHTIEKEKVEETAETIERLLLHAHVISAEPVVEETKGKPKKRARKTKK
jgi:hypothetical protein